MVSPLAFLVEAEHRGRGGRRFSDFPVCGRISQTTCVQREPGGKFMQTDDIDRRILRLMQEKRRR
ncbi:hypothetical protein CNY89_10895 [Amaricoccus sp. HAR-UPW-R2A-40]|nr:hypothetical protein CNY89_10895 [Amaricoccus sp. HAR-UPW-R2A-40]